MLWLEDQPLDLSLKSKSSEREINSVRVAYNNFNFDEFYRTYLAISVRSRSSQHHGGGEALGKQNSSFPEGLQRPTSAPVKRARDHSQPIRGRHQGHVISLEQSDVSASMKRKLSNDFDNEAKKLKLDRTTKNDAKIKTIIQRRKKEEMRTSCDCRFCYEDHIRKLRAKSNMNLLNPRTDF